MSNIFEDLAMGGNKKVINDPLNKAHHLSQYVIVWWYDFDSGELFSEEGREIRHRNLKDFPGMSDTNHKVRGRVFRWEDKLYNCLYDYLTHYQLSDLTVKLQSKYGFYIDFSIDSVGNEIEGK